MALTAWRWIALALAGFALAPIVLLERLHSPEWRPTERDRLIERDQVAQVRLRRAADQLRVLQIRDSVLRIIGARSIPTVRVDPALDSISRTLLDSLVSAARAQQPLADRLPIPVFFVLDTVSTVRGQPRPGVAGALSIDYVLPTDSARRCVVVARVRMPTTRRLYEAELRSRATRERLLGPCAYFERFGFPGPLIRSWLDQRGWQFAQRSPLAAPPQPWLDGSPDSAWRARIDLEDVMATSGRACVGGRDERCLDALFASQPVNTRRMPLSVTEGVLSSGYFSPFVHGDNAWVTRSWPLGAREWTLLSDMARSLGPEAFERFWTSDLPPAQAFEAAAGRSITTWTREWIETTYHPQATGPVLTAGTTGFAALLLLVALLLAFITASRRQLPR